METSVNSEEVIQTNTLTPYNLPNIQDIKREVCDEDLTLRLDKCDDFDFEPFHENIFRTLSSHFSNKSNINEIDDACLKLENCFIENNILDKNGLTKPTLKGSPNSYIFLKYRDIDDAFVDMVISESVGKFNKNNKYPHKKIDLKHFKDNFFSIDFNDYEDQQSQSSESDSELLGESESFIEPSQSEIDITDGYNSDIESSLTEDTDLLGLDNLVNSGYPRHVRLAKVSNDTYNPKTTDSDVIPLKGTVRDVRIMVEKLRCNTSDCNNVEENLFREISSKSHGTKIKQVARKKTGGMVMNTNIPESNDAEANKEPKNNQPSKEDDLVPDGFDKMTRADRRKLEKIIAESRQNLVTRSDKLLSEKDYGKLSNISYEKKSDGTPNIEELDSPSVEKELENTSNERESASTSNVKESNSMSIEKELDDTSSEDKLKENELLKSVVKNTILDFLIKSKGLKMGKEKVDLISDEITKKLNSFIPDEDGTDADDPALVNAGISSNDDSKMEDNASVKSNENREESSSKKRPTPPKKRTTKRNTSSANTRKRLQEFQEIARDIINCKLSTPLVDELEESLKPTTRQSLAKNDKEVNVDDVSEEPRRPITRQSLAKNDKDKILPGDENEEPRKPTTRQSVTKIDADTLVDDMPEEPRRPVTRQSLTKNEKVGLSNELPKETKRQTNATINKSPARNDKCLTRDEETKRPTIRQSEPNNDTILVPDDDDVDEEPRRPVTRRSSAKNDKDITIDLDKEEPKKHVTRKTVAELERSRALGSILSTLDSEMDEPNRRTTRRSLQRQKEIPKDNNESSVLTNELKPETNASKRKSNSRTKKNTAKKSVKKQRGNNKKMESRDNIDADINDDSVISLSDSDASKSSKILDFSFFSDHTILKASADSTTFESEPNKENANNRLITGDDENLHRSPTITNTESDVMKATEKDSSSTVDTEITFSKSDINIDSEKNDDEVHSQSESVKNYSVVDRVYLPDTSVSVGSLNNLVNSDSNHGSDTSDDNLKNVSKLVEDVLDESIKDKLSQNQESVGSSLKKSFNAILHPSKDKKAPQPVDEPFQILNDMITDIEERLLKEENEANKNSIENELNKDIDKLSTPDKDFFNCHSVTVEVSADSTSFLNYTMDDSFKLMIDESTPQKEDTIKESDSLDLISIGTKENDSKLNLETVLTNSSDASISKKNLNKEALIDLEEDESHTEVFGSKEEEDNKEAGELEKEVEKNHSDLSSLKEDGNNEAIIKSKKDVMLHVEEKVTEEPEEKFIEHSINEKDKPSSASFDQKLSFSCKPLTNEEKIAQLTKRDPRLVNEKKISNVILRDPRLRNKLPKTDEKRDNVLATQNICVSNVIEEKVKISEKLEPKILEPKLPEPLRLEPKLLESKHSEEQKKICEKEMFDQKAPEEKSEPKLVVSKISESKISSSLPEGNIVSLLKDLGGPSHETDAKLPVQSQKSVKNEDYNYDQNRKKRFKKAIDEELLYKTPLSDLHDTHAERSTYERERDFKKKKLFPEGRRVRIITEERERTFTIPRRTRAVEESNEEKRDYNQSALITNPQGLFRRESQEETNFLHPNSDLRADHRYSEEVRFREENLTYEEKTFYQEKREILPSGSNENYEQGSYIRRMVTETSYSETIHNRNDFQDNHIYSRREFYRRNRFAHDHDHLGNSSRLLENSNNVRRENEIYPQHNNYPVVDEPTFNVSAYPPVSFLPEPMYSQEEDLDQSYGNMETESFSPPPLDLCPPPPLIRSPTPEFGRRDKYCPSPPRIGGRRDSTDERDYEEFSRAYHRNYENDERGLRGRSNNMRGQRGGNFRRGNGREYHRWREESPPRKRFAGEHFRGRDEDRGRWRRSPSWSPERSRRWSRERSPPAREQHPWNSPREAHPWDSPPREQHPWNSPPRNRSPSPPRRRDNYRDRSSYYHRY